jgi:hypothetical protein
MAEMENKPLLTPKEGCEECKRLRGDVDSAFQSKQYTIYGFATGYRQGKSRSRQPKQVRQQMDVNDNAERLARVNLRIHEIQAHEGVTESNGREFAECVRIRMRGGRNKP